MKVLIIFAGTPAAREKAGMSCVTTALAAMTTPSPIVTPLKTHAFSPIHTLLPIRISPLLANRLRPGGSKILQIKIPVVVI